MKLYWHIAICTVAILIIIFLYSIVIQQSYSYPAPKVYHKWTPVNSDMKFIKEDVKNYIEIVKENEKLKHKIHVIEELSKERFFRIDTRINDFYIFTGIIITLILTINIGIAWNAESSTAKFFEDNFKDIKDDLDLKLKDAIETEAKIKAIYDAVEKDIDRTEKQQMIPSH